jgi:hypothetical protein
MLCYAYGMKVATTEMDATEPHVTSTKLLALVLSMGEHAVTIPPPKGRRICSELSLPGEGHLTNA